MIQTIRAKATVKPGGIIEVHSDELPEGATVEVIVQVKTADSEVAKPKGLSRFIGATKGIGSFNGSVAEIDEYIRQERDSWDS
ncbi:MAG: hypothetical protein WA885_23575 [Phormidesmis sp.]